MNVDAVIDIGLEVIKFEKIPTKEIFENKDLNKGLISLVGNVKQHTSEPSMSSMLPRVFRILHRYTDELLSTDEGYGKFKFDLMDRLAMIQILNSNLEPREEDMTFLMYIDTFYDYLVGFAAGKVREEDINLVLDFLDYYNSGC